MSKTRIAVLVSGGGTNLQALIDAQKAGVITDGEIVLVLSNNANAYALTRAKNAGIKSAIVIKKNFPTRQAFEDGLLDVLQQEKIDMIVLAGFMCILGEKFVRRYADRIINVHPSLIPSFCGEGFYGLKVHEKALEYGVKVTGATVHLVNEIPDGGKILMQKAVEILDGDTPEILQKRVMEQAEWIILPLATQQLAKQINKEKD